MKCELTAFPASYREGPHSRNDKPNDRVDDVNHGVRFRLPTISDEIDHVTAATAITALICDPFLILHTGEEIFSLHIMDNFENSDPPQPSLFQSIRGQVTYRSPLHGLVQGPHTNR
jgi:hypothetical protein